MLHWRKLGRPQDAEPWFERIRKVGNNYELQLHLPFVGKEDVDIKHREGELFISVGPYKREISLRWYSGTGCAAASVPNVPATLAPDKTVTAALTIDANGFAGPGCSGTSLGGWKSVGYDYLSSLPSDPAALEQILAGSAGPVVASTREQAVFQAISTLLDAGESQGVVVPLRLSATLYRILEQLPGVTFDSATDLAGRQGIGFSMELEGYFNQEIVIDPETYTYMGFKDVVVKNHAMAGTDGTRYVMAGHVLGWGALLGSAIVAKPGQLP